MNEEELKKKEQENLRLKMNNLNYIVFDFRSYNPHPLPSWGFWTKPNLDGTINWLNNE